MKTAWIYWNADIVIAKLYGSYMGDLLKMAQIIFVYYWKLETPPGRGWKSSKIIAGS